MDDILDIIKHAKASTDNEIVIPRMGACLRPARVCVDDAKQMARWRTETYQSFLTWIRPDTGEMLRWLSEINKRDNDIIFIIELNSGALAGQLSLYNVNTSIKEAEFGRLLRNSEICCKGIMRGACKTALKWAFGHLGLEKIFLEVFADNDRAVRLYERVGFQVDREISVWKEKGDDGVVRWSKSKTEGVYSGVLSDCRQLYRMLLAKSEFCG